MSNLPATLQLIKDKLGKGHDLFVKSIFGEFTNVKSVVFCDGFIHHMLLHQLECDDTSVMEFDFNGVGARFDRKAFAMITGLNCGKFPSSSELNNLSYDLWNKYFGDEGPMTQYDFARAFEDLDFDESNDEEIKANVKCCMFYFVEMVLLPADRARLVKKDNLMIINNEDLCKRYPWGNVCYDLTIHSLRSKMDPNKPKTAYSLYGFPLAFQVKITYTFM